MKIFNASLQVILDSICLIESYIDGYHFEAFQNDQKTKDAVLLQLQHIGETTGKMVKNFGDIDFLPTNEMIGLRNFIAHDYLGINEKIIWETLMCDIPKIKDKVQEYLDKHHNL